MQSYDSLWPKIILWPDHVLVEARGGNPALDAYIDAVLDDLKPLLRSFTGGYDIDANATALLQHFPTGPSGVKEDLVEDVLRLVSLLKRPPLRSFKLSWRLWATTCAAYFTKITTANASSARSKAPVRNG